MANPGNVVKMLAERGGWRIHEHYAMGRVNEYPFIVSQNGTSPVGVQIAVWGLDEGGEKLNILQNLFETMDAEYKTGHFFADKHQLSYSVALNPGNDTEGTYANVLASIRALADRLRDLQLAPACSVCGAEGQHDFIRANEQPMAMCASCFNRLRQKADETRLQQHTGSLLSGLVGALLGSLISSVLWFGLSQAGFVASLAGFVMAWLANFGYTKLGGKRNRAAPFIIFSAVLVAIVIAELASVSLSISQDYEVPFLYVLGRSYLIFSEPQFWRSIAVGAVFALVGSFSILGKSWREIKAGGLVVERL